MSLTLKISGFDDLHRKIDRMVASVDRREQGKTLENAAQQILDRMRQLVPVRTGALRASLALSPADDGLAINIGPVGGAGSSGWRAHFIEFGTINMAAQPFIRPSFDGLHGTVTSAIAGRLRSDVLSVARGR